VVARRFVRLVCLLVAVFTVGTFSPAQQTAPSIRLDDNSDWWSTLNLPSFDSPRERQIEIESRDIQILHAEPDGSAFWVAGINLSDSFIKVQSVLGDASRVERGDAASSREQLCYVSKSSKPPVNLIFERGEVDESFYLFIGGPDWNGSNHCLKSAAVSRSLKIANGLQLGRVNTN